MKKLNLDFIGEIISSPAGLSTFYGTTVSFYGKFKDGNYKYESDKYTRQNLIEAVKIEHNIPPDGYFRCSALMVVPEQHLFINDEQT